MFGGIYEQMMMQRSLRPRRGGAPGIIHRDGARDRICVEVRSSPGRWPATEGSSPARVCTWNANVVHSGEAEPARQSSDVRLKPKDKPVMTPVPPQTDRHGIVSTTSRTTLPCRSVSCAAGRSSGG